MNWMWNIVNQIHLPGNGNNQQQGRSKRNGIKLKKLRIKKNNDKYKNMLVYLRGITYANRSQDYSVQNHLTCTVVKTYK